MSHVRSLIPVGRRSGSSALLLVLVEYLGEVFPALVVVNVEILLIHRVVRDFHHVSGLKHECHGALADLLWLEVSIGGFEEDVLVWAVATHGGMQAGGAGHEADLLRVVDTRKVAHELCHSVAVVVGGAESVLLDQPAGWEDNEITNGLPRVVCLRCQDSKDRGVRVIEGDRFNSIELSEVILVGCVVSMPSDNIERGVVIL